MNFSELINEHNATFEQYDVNETEQQRELLFGFAISYTLRNVFEYVSMTLGTPGNILSAIVWLRLHVTGKNSSAVYLAALAINDLVYLLIILSYRMIECVGWLCYCCDFLSTCTAHLEPLLVLCFSVERLIAISCPLQVRCMRLYVLV